MFFSFLLFSSVASAELFTAWKPYSSELTIPEVIDMRDGGSIDMHMGTTTHSWGSGLTKKGIVYGYGKSKKSVSYPGPTILTRKDRPISINWINDLSSPHLLKNNIEPSLLMNVSRCYPNCGVPAIVHVHGLEVPPEYDGLPIYSFGKGKSRKDIYYNTQPAATLIYHDHAMGLTRLNVWAGLVGSYVIEDSANIDKQIRVSCDIPLIIQDKLLDTTGNIVYPESPCSKTTKWAPESYGTVNLVNGVVFPYKEVYQEQCRLRLINAANARNYDLKIPFAKSCKMIAKDSGYLNNPIQLSDNETITLYPFERVDLFCDFSSFKLGTFFNITNNNTDNNGASDIIQFRVKEKRMYATKVVLPKTLNRIKDLRTLWKQTGGTTRNITLNEITDNNDCPVALTVSENNQIKEFMKDQYIQCERGEVEKWNFKNPTEDFHPFHWHLVHFQCGTTDDTPNTNEIKDVFPIPPGSGSDDIKQVCYVACTPGNYLIEKSIVKPTDFGFPIKNPYLVHCHILEHEENDMMTWFYPK